DYLEAERRAAELERLTTSSDQNPQTLRQTTNDLTHVLTFALQDQRVSHPSSPPGRTTFASPRVRSQRPPSSRQIAEEMMTAISNLLGANVSVLEESDPNGEAAQAIYDVINSFTNDVPLEPGSTVAIRTENLFVQAEEIDPRQVDRQALVFSPGSHQREINSSRLSWEPRLEFPEEILKMASAALGRNESLRLQFAAFENDKLFARRGDGKQGRRRRVVAASIRGVRVQNLTDPVVYTLPNPWPGRKVLCIYWKEEVIAIILWGG
ncbi:unnamed protein product, partial [Darwinula stevensoni]